MSSGSLFAFAQYPKDFTYLIPITIAILICGIGKPMQTVLIGKIFSGVSKFGAGEYNSSGAFMKDVTIYSMSTVGLGAGLLLSEWLMVTVLDLYAMLQVERARDQIFHRFLSREFTYYDRSKGVVGTVSILIRAFEDYKQAASLSFGLNAKSLVSIVSAFIIAMIYSWQLTLISLASLPLIIGFTGITTAPMTKALTDYKSTVEDAANILTWTLNAFSTVKQFNAQLSQIKAFERFLNQGYQFYKKFTFYVGLQQGISRFAVLAMFVPAFVVGGNLVRAGKIESGDVLTVFWCSMLIANSFSELGLRMEPYQKGIIASAKLQGFLSLDVSASTYFKSMIGLFPNKCHGSIILKNVS